MTMNTRKQLLLGLLVIATVGSFGLSNQAFASHGLGSWTHDTIDFKCLASIANLVTSSAVDSCGDLTTAVAVWNNVDSELYFNYVVSGEDMTVGSANLDSGTYGVNALTFSGGDVIDSDISFNTDYEWGDKAGADWWTWWHHDYLSVAIHEFGHAVSMDHDSNSNLMKDSHSFGSVYRTPSSHDEDVVEGYYP